MDRNTFYLCSKRTNEYDLSWGFYIFETITVILISVLAALIIVNYEHSAEVINYVDKCGCITNIKNATIIQTHEFSYWCYFYAFIKLCIPLWLIDMMIVLLAERPGITSFILWPKHLYEHIKFEKQYNKNMQSVEAHDLAEMFKNYHRRNY